MWYQLGEAGRRVLPASGACAGHSQQELEQPGPSASVPLHVVSPAWLPGAQSLRQWLQASRHMSPENAQGRSSMTLLVQPQKSQNIISTKSHAMQKEVAQAACSQQEEEETSPSLGEHGRACRGCRTATPRRAASHSFRSKFPAAKRSPSAQSPSSFPPTRAPIPPNHTSCP